jgi:hypothetical protein
MRLAILIILNPSFCNLCILKWVNGIIINIARLRQVESLLTSEDSGKDLASVQNLMKKHQLVEADIQAHEDRINGEYCT